MTIRQRIGLALVGKAYSTDWFVDFMKLATDEDAGEVLTVEGSYNKIAWLNIAICARARNLARAVWKLYSGDTEVDGGPEYDLFNNGVFNMTRYQLWEQTEGWRCLKGEAFWILDFEKIGKPTGIVIPDPRLMTEIIDKTNKNRIEAWIYDNEGQKIPFRPEEVIHFPFWNPGSRFRGQSEFKALTDELSQEWQAVRGGTKLLMNQSIPAGVITIPGDNVGAEQAERTIERWEKRHRGVSRAGRVAVLGSGATYERIAFTPQEMQSIETRGWNRDTILAKLGVPHAAVGLKDQTSTLSGKDTMEQMRAFWNLTLIPEIKYYEDKLEKDYFTRYAPNLTGKFDLSEIPELQEDENLKADRELKEIAAGRRTINEVREAAGENPVPWGDTWWVPISLTPADVAREHAENPPEPMPFEEEEEEPKAIADLLAVQIPKVKIYTPEYRTKHWEGVIKSWEGIENRYAKDIKQWSFGIRSDIMRLMSEGREQYASRLVEFWDAPVWQTWDKELKTMTRKYGRQAISETGRQLNELFNDLGVGVSFNIWDTRAVQLLDTRVDKVKDITERVRTDLRKALGEAIEGGFSEEQAADYIRGKCNIVQNRAPTIARTEIGGVINDSRWAGFKEIDVEETEWLSAKDERVRRPPESKFDHAIDGERRKMDETFSNGLLYPNDPGGEAGNVINCRCLVLPVIGGR